MKSSIKLYRIFSVLLCAAFCVLLCSGCESRAEREERERKEQLIKAQTFFENEEYEDARHVLQKIIDSTPEDSRAYGMLSEVYLAQKNWESSLNTLEVGMQKAKNPDALFEKREELVQKIEAEKKAAAVFQPVLTYWGDTYYWKYNAESVENRRIQPDYPYQSQTENSLICRMEDGSERVLYTGKGSGSMVIFHDNIYFNAGGEGMQCVPLKKGKESFLPDMKLIGCDFFSDRLFLQVREGDSFSVKSMHADGSRTAVAAGEFLAVHKGLVYYQPPQRKNDSRVLLCSAEIDGTGEKTLARVLLYQQKGKGSIRQVQIVGDTVYFSYGLYDKKNGTFQEIGISQVGVDGSDYKKIADIPSPWFSVYLDEGMPVVRVQKTDGAIFQAGIPAGQSVSLCYKPDTGSSFASPMPAGSAGTPFADEKGSLWIYPDLTGTPVQLLSPAEDFLSSDKMAPDFFRKTVSEPCISGGYLYFTAIRSKYDASSPGKNEFRRVSSELKRKELSTGKTETIYAY